MRWRDYRVRAVFRLPQQHPQDWRGDAELTMGRKRPEDYHKYVYKTEKETICGKKNKGKSRNRNLAVDPRSLNTVLTTVKMLVWKTLTEMSWRRLQQVVTVSCLHDNRRRSSSTHTVVVVITVIVVVVVVVVRRCRQRSEKKVWRHAATSWPRYTAVRLKITQKQQQR